MGEKSFDVAALTYDDKPMHIERAEIIAKDIKKNVNIIKSWTIGDFGCGTGLLGFNFINDVAHIDMMDTSDTMLDRIREKIKINKISNVEAIFFDIEKDRLPYGRYEMIITSMTFHHIADLNILLKKLSAMLKNGGYLAVADLDEEDGSYHDGTEVPHHGINQTSLLELACKNGFELVYKSLPYTIKKEIMGQKRSFPVFLHIYRRS